MKLIIINSVSTSTWSILVMYVMVDYDMLTFCT